MPVVSTKRMSNIFDESHARVSTAKGSEVANGRINPVEMHHENGPCALR